MAGYEDRPRTRAELDRRIEREFGFRQGYASVAAVMAAAVVARLLPSGAVKGGSALRLRYGDGATRFTDDVDVARTGTEGKYRDALALSLRDGWGGFSGTIEELPGHHIPNGLQRRYAMTPYLVHLSYLGQPWADVRLEVRCTVPLIARIEGNEMRTTRYGDAILVTCNYRLGLMAWADLKAISGED